MAFRPIRKYKAAGRYPATEHQARHLYRNADNNGLGAAFVRVQGRVLMDPERLEALLTERARQAATPSPAA